MAVVWKAGSGETEAVAGLLVEFRDWLARDVPTAASVAAGVSRLIADPATEYLLGALEPGDEAAGVCQLRFRYGIWHAAEDCWLEDLFVREQARGCGIGRALSVAALERAGRRGCARVELDVSEANTPALALYEQLGFTAVSEPEGGRNLMMRRYALG